MKLERPKRWHNYHWLVRHLAAMQSCMDTDGMIRVGPEAGGQVTLKCQPFSFTVSKGIDETKLTAAEEVSDEVADQIPVEDDDQAEIKSDDEDDD